MNLSDHFSMDEFEASDTAARLGLDNKMVAAEIENARRLCALILEPLHAHFGITHINSGFRSKAVNTAVGSKDTSQHTKGQAADVTVKDVAPIVVCRWLAASGLPFDQVIHEFGRWTHVSIAAPGATPRRMLLTIDKRGTKNGLNEVAL